MELSRIKEKVKDAIENIYNNDSDLFDRENYEVTISCKLAQYLHDKSTDFSVDCEYNKHINGEKRVEELGKNIRPDIVIHNRGTDEGNIVYVEIKTDHNSDSREDDITKIKSMTKQNGEYRYKLGIFIDFNRNKENLIIKFFENGEVIE